VVEIDGEIHDQQREYDAERDEYLASIGYTVLRFTVDQVIGNMEGVLAEIRIALTTAIHTP